MGTKKKIGREMRRLVHDVQVKVVGAVKTREEE